MNKQSSKNLMTLFHCGLVLFGALVCTSDKAFAFPVSTGANPYRAHAVPEKGNIAIFGYDPVAYFIEGRAVKGKDEFEYEFADVRWRFSSAENRDAFIDNPDGYLPRYGGFCTVCIVENEGLFDANPKIWTIVKGKLYLNNDLRSREKFRRNASLYIEWADAVWGKLAAPAVRRISNPNAQKIAIFPMMLGNPSNPNAEEVEFAIKDTIKSYLDTSESFEIAYDYDSAPAGGPVVTPEQVWSSGFGQREPVLDSVTQLAEQIGVEGVVMAWARPGNQVGVDRSQSKLYVFDLDQGNVYKEKGLVVDFNDMLQKAFSKLASERKKEASESYRIAVMDAGYSYEGTRWKVPGDSAADAFLGVAGSIYSVIQEQSSFTISYADEPPDPSARSTVNRGGDWPFPGTNIDRKEVWEWEVDVQHMTPKLERVYRAGRELGVDGVVMYYFRPAWRTSQWSLEVYMFDIEQQHVYVHKGTNWESSKLVRQAFSDFVAGRKQ